MNLNEKIQYLKELVAEAELLLEDKIHYSHGNRMALKDMLDYAKAELNDTYELPFSNCREFYEFEKEARIDFVTSRYTMVATYPKAINYTFYGLKDSIAWFKTKDIRLYDNQKKQFFLEEAKTFLENAKVGTDISCYPKETIDTLKVAVDQFNKESILSVVQLINALKEARVSVIYRGDLTEDNYLYFGKATLQELLETAKKDESLSKRMEEILEYGNRYSLEHVKRLYSYTEQGIDYEEYNSIEAPWNTTERRVSFQAPKGATNCSIEIILPAVDNESDGLGHVWIDNFGIISGNGEDLLVPCTDFSDAEVFEATWEQVVVSGSPILQLSKEYYLSGSASMYIENPTSEDSGGFLCKERIAVESGAWYSVDMNAKLDGKPVQGLEVKFRFYDDAGNYIEDFDFTFNKKAWPMDCMDYALYAQTAALSHYITGEIEYAIKAKYMLLVLLDNFCQGSHHWLMFQSRPEDSDCYGAVQGGRLLMVVASSYSLIRNLGVFTPEEKAKFYGMIDYQLRYMIDLRDRTELSYHEAQMHSGNWQSDMCIGTSMIMAVMEDFPNRKSWMLNAYWVLKGQLEEHLNDDGSWPESIRYNHAVLQHFSTYGMHLLFETGENWFTNTRLTEIFRFLVNMQTPQFSVMDHAVSTPPFGDHMLSNGHEFAYFGSYVNLISQFNKKLADEMFATWQRAGSKLVALGFEKVVVESILCSASTYQTADDFQFDLTSTKDFVNSGHYIFRGKCDDGSENYLAVMSSPKKIAHGHRDQGAIITYYKNTPLVMDTGIEGYFDASTIWHLSSYSHPCLLFSTKEKMEEEVVEKKGFINLSAGDYSVKRGYNDTPISSKVLDVKLGDTSDCISIEIQNEGGRGTHVRNVEFQKETGVITLEDVVSDFEEDVLVSFPVITKKTRVEGNKIHCECLDNIILQIEVCTPFEEIIVDQGRIFSFALGTKNINAKADNSINIIDVIRIKAKGSDGVKTILTPMEQK